MTSPTLLDNPTESQIPLSSATPIAPDNIRFPESAFVGLGNDFVDIYRPRLESPPEFLFASWHACFGAAISPYVRLNSVLDLPPRIYVVILHRSPVH